MVTQIYEIGSEILDPLPPKFVGPKRQNFCSILGNFEHLWHETRLYTVNQKNGIAN